MELDALREKVKEHGIVIVQRKKYYGRQVYISIDGIPLESSIPMANYNMIKDKIQLLTDIIGDQKVVYKGDALIGFKDYRRVIAKPTKNYRRKL